MICPVIHALPGLSTIHTAVRGLLEAGIVDTTSGGTRIADPFFARFIRSSAAKVFCEVWFYGDCSRRL